MKLAAARRLANDTVQPAPPTPEEQRTGAADRARHERYGRAEILLRRDIDQADAEDARAWDAERNELHEASRIGGSEAFNAINLEET
jgi:hypothetical protein